MNLQDLAKCFSSGTLNKMTHSLGNSLRLDFEEQLRLEREHTRSYTGNRASEKKANSLYLTTAEHLLLVSHSYLLCTANTDIQIQIYLRFIPFQ